MHYVLWLQELLRSHGLVEPESCYVAEDQAQRRKRLTEHHRLHQLKREHELKENSYRKVLHLEEGLEQGLSCDSDEEAAGSSKKDKDSAAHDVDIQVLTCEKQHKSKDIKIYQYQGWVPSTFKPITILVIQNRYITVLFLVLKSLCGRHGGAMVSAVTSQ